MEQEKIETKSTSVRLPLDVLETLQRWATETGQSVAGCITTCVRVALEDEKRITRGSAEGESVLQDNEAGASVIQVRRPAGRDELANAFTLLLHETETQIGERDQISALGVARARVYKTTDAYKLADAMRAKSGMQSPYEDEKALADRLSAS